MRHKGAHNQNQGKNVIPLKSVMNRKTGKTDCFVVKRGCTQPACAVCVHPFVCAGVCAVLRFCILFFDMEDPAQDPPQRPRTSDHDHLHRTTSFLSTGTAACQSGSMRQRPRPETPNTAPASRSQVPHRTPPARFPDRAVCICTHHRLPDSLSMSVYTNCPRHVT